MSLYGYSQLGRHRAFCDYIAYLYCFCYVIDLHHLALIVVLNIALFRVTDITRCLG